MRRVMLVLAVASSAGITVAAQSTQTSPTPTAGSPAGPAAYTCGNPTNPPQTSGRGAPPIFPPGQFNGKRWREPLDVTYTDSRRGGCAGGDVSRQQQFHFQTRQNQAAQET